MLLGPVKDEMNQCRRQSIIGIQKLSKSPLLISTAKMYLLQKAHPIIDDTLRPRLLGSGEGAENQNPLREPCELKICDLDDVVYKVWATLLFSAPTLYLPILPADLLLLSNNDIVIRWRLNWRIYQHFV